MESLLNNTPRGTLLRPLPLQQRMMLTATMGQAIINKNSHHFSRARLVPGTVLSIQYISSLFSWQACIGAISPIYTRRNWGPEGRRENSKPEWRGDECERGRALELNYVDISPQLPDSLGPSWWFGTNMVFGHKQAQWVSALFGTGRQLKIL